MKQQKSNTPRRHYDAEFKSNALQMLENGRSVKSLSQALGIKESLLYNWKSKARKQKNAPEKREENEVKALRKELKEVKEERDILKKALSIFSRQN